MSLSNLIIGQPKKWLNSKTNNLHVDNSFDCLGNALFTAAGPFPNGTTINYATIADLTVTNSYTGPFPIAAGNLDMNNFNINNVNTINGDAAAPLNINSVNLQPMTIQSADLLTINSGNLQGISLNSASGFISCNSDSFTGCNGLTGGTAAPVVIASSNNQNLDLQANGTGQVNISSTGAGQINLLDPVFFGAAPQTGLSYYEYTGAIAVNWSEGGGAPVGSFLYLVRIGQEVTCILSTFALVCGAGPSNVIVSDAGIVPAQFRPSNAMFCGNVLVLDTTAGVQQNGWVGLSPAGTFNIYFNSIEPNYTPGNTVGLAKSRNVCHWLYNV